ncbi:MAG: B12-binding domain-containing radical SAM protein [Candidatus Odinarchaeum yellowstonii]|uniref:B12-binding domain-containing radical SAM protein n=1 Tax=Odinarchaeota yellowstonii (strain LCB_4) TaxID=1841599 RepID=A0AAF0IB92_ODILC|nr:MAG: B12-binding domain-containing radical SAM protein [Candidatus Odinarchaeum yellowstonii]
MSTKEVNVIRKKYSKRLLNIGLLYPNKYQAGVESLAIQILYMLFNSESEFYCQRFYSNPPYTSMESGARLCDFKILCVTFQYENDYLNFIKTLLDAGIEPRAANRVNGPLIIAGGPCVVENPLPLTPFIDVFIIGEVEPVFPALKNAILSYISSKDLGVFKSIPGAFIPSIKEGETVRRVWAANLDDLPYPICQVLPAATGLHGHHPVAFGSSFLVEISRGCTRRCNFCLIGCQTPPYRERSLQRLEEIILNGVNKTLRNRISIISSVFSDYSNILELLKFIVDHRIYAITPSLRADSITVEIVKLIGASGEQSITIAPEAASDRLLEYLNKKLTVEDVLNAAEKIKLGGLNKMKLYFMYGLPSEEIEDTLKIKDLVDDISLKGFKKKDITVNLTPFIPKPHTPFQRMPQTPFKELVKRESLLVKNLRRAGYNVRSYDIKSAVIQTVLSRGDRRVGDVLEMAVKLGGTWLAWRRTVKKLKFNEESFIREMSDKTLPWDFIKI